MHKLSQAQEAVAASLMDGWLVYDFRHSNPLLWQLLGASLHSTRRVFLWLPREGTPSLLVHQVDAGHFPHNGLEVCSYRDGDDLLRQLRSLLAGKGTVAMEYSPMGALPTLSHVDGGTLELVRSLGVTIESSAELAQHALCRLTPEELASHRRAAAALGDIVIEAFDYIAKHAGGGIREHQVAGFIRERFTATGLETDSGPIVAVNGHAGDPHYEPQAPDSAVIRAGDWVLIDLWAKEPGGIYGDITWVACLGEPSAEQQCVFDVVTGGRDAAVAFLQQEAAAGRYAPGAAADGVAREYIKTAGYGEQFTHRLGHSLGDVVHGYGANLDGYETQEPRRLVPGLAFTIEPGVYLPAFGVRSEIDLYMTEHGPESTTVVQREIVRISVK